MAKATFNEVTAIPAPAFTPSWHPFSHGDTVRAMYEAADLNDLAIVHEHYDLTARGNNLFATFSVRHTGSDHDPADYDLQLGFRNSINKSFAFGIVTGLRVIVCSNLSFSGEFLNFRKHTGGLDLTELFYFAARAVSQSKEKMSRLANWQDRLKNYTLLPDELKCLTYNALTTGAITPSKFTKWQDNLAKEQKLNGPTLYSWHGAGTRTCRENSLSSIAIKTSLLNQHADDYLLSLAA